MDRSKSKGTYVRIKLCLLQRFWSINNRSIPISLRFPNISFRWSNSFTTVRHFLMPFSLNRIPINTFGLLTRLVHLEGIPLKKTADGDRDLLKSTYIHCHTNLMTLIPETNVSSERYGWHEAMSVQHFKGNTVYSWI